MVHERLGIKNNRIDLSRVPGITKELKVTGQQVVSQFPYVSNADYADASTPVWAKVYGTRKAKGI